MVLIGAEKTTALTTAQNAYSRARLPDFLGVPIGTQLSDDIINNSTTGLFGWIKTALSSSNLQMQKDGCGWIHQNVDQPYKNIITPLTGDIGTIPTEIVTQNIQALQVELANLQQTVEDRKKDQQTAIVRDKVLRSGNGAVTNHQIYLLGRPLRPASIPFLWALSTLFIGFALLIFYTYYPYTTPPLDVILFDLYLLFVDPFTWAILFSLASIVILFLSLRIAKIL